MAVNVKHIRAGLNEEEDPEAATVAVLMGQLHVLLAAIHEAARAALGTEEPA